MYNARRGFWALKWGSLECYSASTVAGMECWLRALAVCKRRFLRANCVDCGIVVKLTVRAHS